MKLKCPFCNDIIQSKNTHDFVKCKCRKSFVDGGNEYFRFGSDDMKRVKIYNNKGEEKKIFD